MTGNRGERLDHYLVRSGLAASRRRAREMIEHGRVRINGVPSRKGAFVKAGDKVQSEEPPQAVAIRPEPLAPLEILYSDDSAVVVNKPGGTPCHPLQAGEIATVMNAVVARFPETARAGRNPLEGGLVHRLDNGTSGALIIARTNAALVKLRRAIGSGRVRRRYQALVAGALESPLELTWPVAHHPRNPRKMVTLAHERMRHRSRAQTAITRVEPLHRVGAFTEVSVFPTTGARHQIRVHLAAVGFPIASDTLYGGPPLPGLGPDRFWLHLAEIEFDSPSAGAVRVAAPLPADLAAARAKASAHWGAANHPA